MSRTSQLTIEAPAPWLNSNMRLHRMQAAKLTAAWREAGRASVGLEGLEPYAGPVHIFAHVYKPRGGRYDAGNLYPTVKAVLDGIVDSGLLVDDSNEYVIGPDMRHGGKGPAALVLTITEAQYFCPK